MIVNEVGETAGLLWHTLEAQGPMKLAQLKKQLKASDTMLLMALGWLAREDKIEFESHARSFIVRLK